MSKVIYIQCVIVNLSISSPLKDTKGVARLTLMIAVFTYQ